MRKLTNAEIAMPNVTLVIPEAKFYQLPHDIQEVLRLYIGKYDKRGNMVYTIPGYLYRDWTHQLPAKGVQS